MAEEEKEEKEMTLEEHLAEWRASIITYPPSVQAVIDKVQHNHCFSTL